MAETRSTPELIAASLVGDRDDQAAWDAVVELQRRGAPDVFEAAARLLRSVVPKERERGADILAQLGTPKPSTEVRERCATELLAVVRSEKHPDVLHAIGIALGHLEDPRALADLLALKEHEDPQVRYGAVFGLNGLVEQEAAVSALIELSRDSDSDVRDWATFGLGTLSKADSPAIREALVARLTDSDADTQGEALVGLARRRDLRIIPFLRAELGREDTRVYALESAEELGDAQLLPELLKMREGVEAEGYFSHCLESAIAALEAVQKKTNET
jgi:HEAT repeat protein